MVPRDEDLDRIARIQKQITELHRKIEDTLRTSREVVWRTHQVVEGSRFLLRDPTDGISLR